MYFHAKLLNLDFHLMFEAAEAPENFFFISLAYSILISSKIGSGVPMLWPAGTRLLSTVGSLLISASKVSCLAVRSMANYSYTLAEKLGMKGSSMTQRPNKAFRAVLTTYMHLGLVSSFLFRSHGLNCWK